MSANVAVEGAKVRLVELAMERGLSSAGADRVLALADFGNFSEAHLAKEAARLVEQIAVPTDFVDGRSAAWQRALRRRIVEERKLKEADPGELARRLSMGNVLNERITKLRRD